MDSHRDMVSVRNTSNPTHRRRRIARISCERPNAHPPAAASCESRDSYPPSLATRFACRRSEPYRERARLLANALPVAIPPPHACNTTTVDPAPRADATLADLTPPPPPPQPPLRGARCGFSAAATPVEATPVEAPPLTPESCDRRRLVAIPVACPLHCARRRRWSRRAVRRCPAS